MRAALCTQEQASVRLRETRTGPGIGRIQGRIRDSLFAVIGDWLENESDLRVIMSGAVGSNVGLREIPYLACPLSLELLADHCQVFTEDDVECVIVPGLKSAHDDGRVDVMRGEELQLLGWWVQNAAQDQGRQHVCLPGTHTKWVTVEAGDVRTFSSTLSGELYDLLLHQSVLFAGFVSDDDSERWDGQAFETGVKEIHARPGALPQSLFQVRSRQLLGLQDFHQARSYLSGLVIGADVKTALQGDFSDADGITIIGDADQGQRYLAALSAVGCRGELHDVRAAVTCGHGAIQRRFG
jgi:2-dehydro-3-deoxygalactonokinase